VVTADIVVFTSAVWATTCTAVRSRGVTVLIDSPVFPEELAAVPKLLEEHGFPIEGLSLFTTHGDWDHILGPLMFPKAPLLCGQSTADRLAADPEDLDSSLRAFDEMFYVKRPEALTLDRLEPLSVPGDITVGDIDISLVQADGHTVDGTAALLRGARVLAAGDYLSPVEVPRLRGPLDAHLHTLDRLEATLAEVAIVIPGHGHPISRDLALKVLAEDRTYLQQLRDLGQDAALPPGRDDGEQQRVHRDMNVPTVEGRPVRGAAGGNLPG